MAAISINFNMNNLGISPSGGLIFEIQSTLCDPALQGDGSGHDARFISCVVTLDPASPQTWADDIEAAIIAEAAAQPQPFTLTAARTIMPVFSEQPTVMNKDVRTPANGFNITIGPLIGALVLNPAGLLATGTITMPASPQDGRLVRISSSQVITLLTLNPSGGGISIVGAIATLGALGSAEYIFDLASSSWYRIG